MLCTEAKVNAIMSVMSVRPYISWHVMNELVPLQDPVSVFLLCPLLPSLPPSPPASLELGVLVL